MEVESIDYIKCLTQADYFLCCTQRQKAFHTAWLFMSGLGSKGNPLDVIPISANPDLPVRPSSDFDKKPVFLYGGVLWPWRTPEAWISKLLDILVVNTCGQLQLIIGKYPLHEASSSGNLHLPQGPEYEKVLKQSDLLPYDEMEKCYLKADIGIELSERNSEREFSFSFRVIEYLRCGLPVICNDFLEVAHLIKEYDAGWVLDSDNNKAFEIIVNRIVSGKEDLSVKRANAQRLIKEKFNYYETIDPLVGFCKSPIKRQKNNHFLMSLVKHDQNVHDLQSNITALQKQTSDKEKLLIEQEARISQFETERDHMAKAHDKIVSTLENTQAVLNQDYEQNREELRLWQKIAEERRLSTRLKRLQQRFLSFDSSSPSSPTSPTSPSSELETCLFQAKERNQILSLPRLFEQLSLSDRSELSATEQKILDYQQQALDHFFLHTDVKDKTVLEIGADNAVLLSELAQQGMHSGLGINNWYWSDKNPKTVKVADNIILSYGDINSLPLEDNSFDIIFTVAAFEHIHGLDVALTEMYRLLKPGGLIFSLFGPLWSSGTGHHLWFERDGKWYRFSEEESTLPILKNYEHLLFNKEEMREKLSNEWDQESVEHFLYQIYDSEHINRYMYADYLRMFNESDFELVYLQNLGEFHIEPEVKDQLHVKFKDGNDFTCSTLEVVLKKPDTRLSSFYGRAD